MKPEMITVIALTTLAILLVFVLLGTLFYEAKNRNIRLTERDERDWLFSSFHETVFSLVFKNENAEKLCGIEKAEYLRFCKIIHKPPEFKKIVAMRIEGAIILFMMLLLGYSMSYSTLAEIFCFAIGGLAFYGLWAVPYARLKSKVEDKLYYVSDDLPRFLSLLEKAMDLPIDQAMVTTAKKFDSPLSEDLIDSINKVSLGANGWQETLLELAKTYQIEDFSDVVLEIINSYEQGVNIRPVINRKAYEVEQNRMYAVEAHDSKIKTMIYIPIIAFKVLPLMVLICLPMAKDFF